MNFKFAFVLALPMLFLSMAQAVTVIPNELGAPRAGGLPRESSPDYEIVYGSVRVGDELQRVIVTRPPGNDARPALLFVGGMGCYSLDFSGTGPQAVAYQRVIDLAGRLGFVTMRVEKSGMGDSVGTPCMQQDFHREVSGFLAGLQALAKYPFVKADQIYIFGHSIGGVIAPILASQVPVKSIAVMGTLAGNWGDYELVNTKRQMLLSGMSPAAVAQELKKKKIQVDEMLRKKRTPEDIARQYPEVAGYLEQPVHYTYMQELEDIQMSQEWGKSNSKVLILSGASDFIGSQYAELSQMVNEVNKTRRVPMQLLSVENLDHFFMNSFNQQESFNRQHAMGIPLVFQQNILTVLQDKFFK